MSTQPLSPLPRLGFFGGSFDPPHLGHLAICQLALEQANLEFLLVCPAYHAPLRDQAPLFSSDERMEMARLLCQEDERLRLCSLELDQKKTCFTHDTISEIGKTHPGYEILLLLGDDQLKRLDQWQSAPQLARMVHFLVFARESSSLPPLPLPNLRMTCMNNPLFNFSSTSIRTSLMAGKLPKDSLPQSIERYILDQNLFPLSPH